MNREQIGNWLSKVEQRVMDLENKLQAVDLAKIDDYIVNKDKKTQDRIKTLKDRIKTLEDNVNYFIKQQREWNKKMKENNWKS